MAFKMSSYLVVVRKMCRLTERDNVRVYISRGDTTAEVETSMETVAEVKRRIAEDPRGEGKVPAKAQRLIVRGRELEDSRTLADYDIRHDYTVYMLDARKPWCGFPAERASSPVTQITRSILRLLTFRPWEKGKERGGLFWCSLLESEVSLGTGSSSGTA